MNVGYTYVLYIRAYLTLAKDLMIKYHNNESIVNEIVRSKDTLI